MNLKDLCIIDSFFGSGTNYTRSTLLTCVADKTLWIPTFTPQRNLEKQQKECFEYSGDLQVNRRCSMKEEKIWKSVAGEHARYCLLAPIYRAGLWLLVAIRDINQTTLSCLTYRPETRREETSTGQPSTLEKDHLYTNHILISFSYITLVLKLSHYPEANDASAWLSFLLQSCPQWSK